MSVATSVGRALAAWGLAAVLAVLSLAACTTAPYFDNASPGDLIWREQRGIISKPIPRKPAASPDAALPRGKWSSPAVAPLALRASATHNAIAWAPAWPLHRAGAPGVLSAGVVLALYAAGLAPDKQPAAGEVAEFSEGQNMVLGRRKRSTEPEKVSPLYPFQQAAFLEGVNTVHDRRKQSTHPARYASVFLFLKKRTASGARQLLVVNGAPECGHVVNARRCPHVHAQGSVIHIARAYTSWGLV